MRRRRGGARLGGRAPRVRGAHAAAAAPHGRACSIPALVVLAAAIVAAVLSPPGRAVFERVREAVGVEHADPALFSLPAPGRLLVVSTDGGGVWLVRDNGFKRRLGSYADAQWSPHGLFVVATTPQPPRSPSTRTRTCAGRSRAPARRCRAGPARCTDTRIAYLARERPARRRRRRARRPAARLDRDAGRAGVGPGEPSTSRTSPAAARSCCATRSRAPCVWRAPGRPPAALARMVGRRAAARRHVGARASSCSAPTAASCARSARSARRLDHVGVPAGAATSSPSRCGSPARSEVKLVDVDHPGRARLLFAGPGTFGDIVWSPDGTTLLVDWPTANQWVFLRGAKVHAVGEHQRGVPARATTCGRACSSRVAGPVNLRAMLNAGDRVPDATLFLGPNEPVTMSELRGGRAEAARLLSLRLVVHLNERNGAPA